MIGIQEFMTALEEALKTSSTITFSCQCEVSYSGRAESFLPLGDRLIIIKEDRTVIVHQPTGNMPVNYMKPGTEITIEKREGRAALRASHPKQKEFLELMIWHAHFISSHKLSDGQGLQLAGTEADMSDMLYANPELIEKGFRPVSREEQTKYGFIDVFGTDSKGILTVVECKRYTADLNAVTQLRRYVEKIRQSKGVKEVRGILASPAISRNAKKMLEDWGFTHVAVTPPKYLERHDKKQQRLDGF
ncbi:MAG TPA: endonuclease NucS [Candidatus Nanoarchaeia archaeon]|nr:endonuclease NucS [Candidatus Nanoarchaeia archaeon]